MYVVGKDRRSDKVAEPAKGRGPATILDGGLGFVLVILTTALLAMVRDGFQQPEVLLVALAYAAVMLVVGRRRSWRVRDFVGRLRGTPSKTYREPDSDRR